MTGEESRKHIDELVSLAIKHQVGSGGSAIRALAEEIVRLRERFTLELARKDAEIARLKSCSTIEMMAENPNVDSHVREWEARCLKAEADLKAEREAHAVVMEKMREAVLNHALSDGHLVDCPHGDRLTGQPDDVIGGGCSENCQRINNAIKWLPADSERILDGVRAEVWRDIPKHIQFSNANDEVSFFLMCRAKASALKAKGKEG